MGIEHDWQAHLAAAGLAAPALLGREASFDIWQQLIRHQLEVVHGFASEEREYLILRERQSGPPPLSGRNLDIFERFLCGVGRKVISYEFELSQSAIAQLLKAALVDMGLDCSPARIPSLLVVLAHAARGTPMHSELNIGEFELENARYRVLSVSFDEPVLT